MDARGTLRDHMKIYRGYRRMHLSYEGKPISQKCVVTVSARPLRQRHDIRRHSDGFEWGYSGSGPAQLALALVADCCGRKYAIPAIYQRVKAILVADLPHDGWSLAQEQIEDAVDKAMQKVGLTVEDLNQP